MMADRMSAGEVCSRKVTTAYRGTLVSDAARLMREQHVGCLVIVEQADPGRVVVGILTDRTIVTEAVAKELDSRLIAVREIMTTDVVTAREQDSVLDLLELMRRKRIRRIPVTGPQNLLIGIVTLDDLLEVLAEEMQAMAGAIGVRRKGESTANP